MRMFTTPREVASFMQNAEGEILIRKNEVYLDGTKRIRELLELKDKEIEHITTKSRLLI